MICNYAQMDEKKIEAVRALEKKLGKTLIAFTCNDVVADTLSDTELDEIRRVEKGLGISLLAVK